MEFTGFFGLFGNGNANWECKLEKIFLQFGKMYGKINELQSFFFYFILHFGSAFSGEGEVSYDRGHEDQRRQSADQP